MSKADLLRRDNAHLIHSLNSRQLNQTAHVWIAGEGAELIDADGKRYIDGLSGLWNVVGEVRGKGLMCAVEMVHGKVTKAEFPIEQQVGAKIYAEARRRGLVSRMRGDVFCLAPPMITSYEQLDRIVAILVESVHAVLGAV